MKEKEIPHSKPSDLQLNIIFIVSLLLVAPSTKGVMLLTAKLHATIGIRVIIALIVSRD